MTFYYVCDRCGDLATITDKAIPEGTSWVCDKCGNGCTGTASLWEFTDKRKALEHAEHIARGYHSRLFRSAV